MVEIIDLRNLDEPTKFSLAQILKKDPTSWFWDVGHHDNLNLNFRIIKHFSSDKERKGIPGPRIRYEVVDNELFAKGSFGKFYRCRFTLSIDDNGVLEIKERKPGRIRLVKEQDVVKLNRNMLEQIRTEATAMQQSDIFHSKPVVEVGGKTYIIMRELPGVDLFSIVDANELTIRERYDLTLALLKALKEQVHDKGYIHRDIKPENILVYRNGDQFEIYIIDFGFIVKSTAFSTDCLGSPVYAASECYNPSKIKNEKTDIYALGYIFKYLWNILPEEPEFFAKVWSLIDKMCEWDMNDRPDIPILIEQFNNLSVLLNPPVAKVDSEASSSDITPEYFDVELESFAAYLGF